MGSSLSTIIIAVVLVVILFFAVKNSIPHFRGEGGCCGGNGKEKLVKPQKLDNVIQTKTIKIEGMRCENCNRRVQNALNEIQGINAKVNGDKSQAVVKLGREISDEELTRAITGLGYRVTEII